MVRKTYTPEQFINKLREASSDYRPPQGNREITSKKHWYYRDKMAKLYS